MESLGSFDFALMGLVLILIAGGIFLKAHLDRQDKARERRIRNNEYRAKLAELVHDLEFTTFELGKLTGYDQEQAGIAKGPVDAKDLSRVAVEAKTALIDWVQETFEFDRASSA